MKITKATILAFLGLALAGQAAFAEVIRYAEFGPNRGSRAAALQWMADEIKERSNGRLEVEFHWGKALLGTKAVLKGVSDGVADAGSVIGFFTPKELVIYNIGDLPVENSDEWVGMRALYDFIKNNPKAQSELADAGVVYITNYTTGPIQLICKERIESIDDLAGKKVRASGPYGKALASLGADVQRMGQGDVYQALDSGLIDCNQNYYYSMKAYKQYEVADHVIELNWGQNMSFGIIMNKAFYEGLSEEDQRVIEEVGGDFIDHFAKVMIQGREQDKQDMIDGIDGDSISVTQLPEAERTKLIEAGKEQLDVWVESANGQGYDGQALLEDYRKRIDKYAAELDDKGYPWTR